MSGDGEIVVLGDRYEDRAFWGPPVQRTPGVCGGRARLAGTRITVWGLVEHRRNGLDDAAILAAVLGLSPEQLAAAWAYAASNENEIEADLRDNAE